MVSPKIEGGYILLARKITLSDIMAKPPLYMKLWVWMLESAVKNRQTYFGAIIRVSQYSFEDSIQKKKPLAIS